MNELNCIILFFFINMAYLFFFQKKQLFRKFKSVKNEFCEKELERSRDKCNTYRVTQADILQFQDIPKLIYFVYIIVAFVIIVIELTICEFEIGGSYRAPVGYFFYAIYTIPYGILILRKAIVTLKVTKNPDNFIKKTGVILRKREVPYVSRTRYGLRKGEVHYATIGTYDDNGNLMIFETRIDIVMFKFGENEELQWDIIFYKGKPVEIVRSAGRYALNDAATETALNMIDNKYIAKTAVPKRLKVLRWGTLAAFIVLLPVTIHAKGQMDEQVLDYEQVQSVVVNSELVRNIWTENYYHEITVEYNNTDYKLLSNYSNMTENSIVDTYLYEGDMYADAGGIKTNTNVGRRYFIYLGITVFIFIAHIAIVTVSAEKVKRATMKAYRRDWR